MTIEENPYQGPASDTDGWKPVRSRAGVSIRGVLVGLPVAFLAMLGAGLVVGLIATATLSFDLEEAARQGGGAVALAGQIPYAHFLSLAVWSAGVLCGGYVAAGYSSDRQIAQGFLVGACIASVLVLTRLVSGNASFSMQDLLVVSFAVVGALGGVLRLRVTTSSR